MYKMASNVGKIKEQVNKEIKNNEEKENEKLARVYTRFDEHKKICDEKFVDVKLCNILHKQTADDVKEIKSDVKTLLRDKFQGRDGLKGDKGDRGDSA
jgi:hypothetical protein